MDQSGIVVIFNMKEMICCSERLGSNVDHIRRQCSQIAFLESLKRNLRQVSELMDQQLNDDGTQEEVL